MLIIDNQESLFLENNADNEPKLKWYQKIWHYFNLCMWYITIGFVVEMCKNDRNKREQIKTKIKYFNPTISEGCFGNKVTWVGRDKPLTDEELEILCKS